MSAEIKFGHHCQIEKYLETFPAKSHQRFFLSLLEGTCTLYNLRGKGKAGVTVLIPDMETLKEIATLVESDSFEKMKEGANMLSACILRDVFKTPNDFMKKKANIPNSIFPSQHVPVKSATDSVVTFETGATATVDTGFRDGSNHRNLAVWNLKGKIGIDGKAAEVFTKPPRTGPKVGKGKTGGYSDDLIPANAIKDRYELAKEVENDFVTAEAMSCTTVNNIYCTMICSLVSHLIETDASYFFEMVYPLMTFTRADFYMMVEPHRFTGVHLILDHVFNAWKNKKDKSCSIKWDDLPHLAGKHKNSLPTCALYTRKDELAELISKLRTYISSVGGPGKITAVKEAYVNLIVHNKVSLEQTTINGVYPEALHKYLEKIYNLNAYKTFADEISFIMYLKFVGFCKEGSVDKSEFVRLAGMIGDYLVEAQDHKKNLVLLSDNITPLTIGSKTAQLDIFVNSSFFLAMPIVYQRENQTLTLEEGGKFLNGVAGESAMMKR